MVGRLAVSAVLNDYEQVYHQTFGITRSRNHVTQRRTGPEYSPYLRRSAGPDYRNARGQRVDTSEGWCPRA